MAFVSGPALPTTGANRATSTCTIRMTSGPTEGTVTRRALLASTLAAMAASLLPSSAKADREYANVGFLGGSDKVDVNNANVRAYVQFKGFYPGLAGIIVSNGPYKSVDEIGDLPGLSPAQKKTLDAFKGQLVALPPSPQYELDKINNGLYK